MLELQGPSRGLLFFSFLYRADLHDQNTFNELLEDLFGKTVSLEPKLNPLLDYYSKEMGPKDNLRRHFFVPMNPQPREFLLSAKLLALNWERLWTVENRRMVNVDVGFITLENFILATTKNYAHRVYLGQNIFADLTYQFSLEQFSPLPWCYPDYQDEQKIQFFTWCRSLLLVSN